MHWSKFHTRTSAATSFVVSVFCIATVHISIAAPTPETPAESETVIFVKTLLNDPAVFVGVRGADLVRVGKGPSNSVEYRITKRQVARDEVEDTLLLFQGESGHMNFMWSCIQGTSEISYEVDWEKQAIEWDKFVSKYWPGFKRVSNWTEDIRRFAPAAETFTTEYALLDRGIHAASLSINIRLADGKISGVTYTDHRGDLPAETPAEPQDPQLINAVSKSLSALTPSVKLKTLSIAAKTRTYVKSANKPPRYFDNLDLRGTTQDGKKVIIEAAYDENTERSIISGVYDAKFLDEPWRPYTAVSDENPTWRSDGKTLYFSTTRDVEHRPWWQRGSSVASPAIWSAATNQVQIIRPLKVVGRDYGSFGPVTSDATGRWAAATFAGEPSQLFMLDMKNALIYFPDNSASIAAENHRLFGYQPQKDSPRRWMIQGYKWLPSKNGIIVSLVGDRDANLYLLQWGKDRPPTELDAVPLVIETGEDRLPSLGKNGTLLAWAHQFLERDHGKPVWQLVVADFAADKIKSVAPQPAPGEQIDPKLAISRLNSTNRRSLELPDRPTSISWDSKRENWLLVTESGTLLRVKEERGGLISEKVEMPKWGVSILRPTAADVSPDGIHTAIAAQLVNPEIYKKTECIVSKSIFLWDGESQTTKPLFDLALNNLPRYKFVATGQAWARIVGDTKRFGLEGIADPSYFVKDDTKTQK